VSCCCVVPLATGAQDGSGTLETKAGDGGAPEQDMEHSVDILLGARKTGKGKRSSRGSQDSGVATVLEDDDEETDGRDDKDEAADGEDGTLALAGLVEVAMCFGLNSCTFLRDFPLLR